MTRARAWWVIGGTVTWVALLALCQCAHAQPISARDVLGAIRASHYNCRQPGQCSRHKITACGQRFNENAMTTAHRTLRCGTRLRVCRAGKCVTVTVNDRGPFVRGRALDLTTGVARLLGFAGVATVTATVVR